MEEDKIPGSCELADQAFAGAEVGDYATTSDTLQNVLGIPRNQVSIVDDVLLAHLKLFLVSVEDRDEHRRTHVFADDGSQAADPHDTYA